MGGGLLYPQNFFSANGIIVISPESKSLIIGDNNKSVGNNNLISGAYNNVNGQGNFGSGFSNIINGTDNTIVLGDKNYIGTVEDFDNPSFPEIPTDPENPEQSYVPAGANSLVSGFKNKTSGVSSAIVGEENISKADKSLVQGFKNSVYCIGGHSEGLETFVGLITDSNSQAQYSHAEGHGTITRSQYSHAEGEYTVTSTSVNGQHVEGRYNLPIDKSPFDQDALLVIGIGNSETDRKNGLVFDKGGNLFVSGKLRIGNNEINAGNGLIPYGNNGTHTNDSVNLGSSTNASAKDSLAIGEYTIASGIQSFAGGKKGGNGETKAEGEASFAFGRCAVAKKNTSFAIGENTIADGDRSFVGGENSKASSNSAFAFGKNVQSLNSQSFVIGENVIASGTQSFAGGKNNTQAFGETSFAFGTSCKAYKNSCAIGKSNIAGKEGNDSITGATAFGESCKAYGKSSFSANRDNESKNENSTTFGQHSIANRDNQFVCGYRNKEDSNAMFIVGNGNSNTRANVFTVHQQGAFQIPVFKYNTETGKYTKTTTNKYIILLEENDMTTFKIIDNLNNLQ